MIGVRVTFLGFDRFLLRLAAMPVAVEAGAEVGKQRGASRLQQAIAAGAPRLTGAMADSVITEGERVEIGVPYWRFVEQGTVNMQAEPFVAPAVDQNERAALEDIVDAAREAVAASAL